MIEIKKIKFVFLCFSFFFLFAITDGLALSVEEAYSSVLEKSSVSFIYQSRIAWQENVKSLAKVKQREYENVAVSNLEELKIKNGFYVTKAENEIQKADIEYEQITINIKNDVYRLYFSIKNKERYIEAIQKEYALLKRIKYEEQLKRSLGFNDPVDVELADTQLKKCAVILDKEKQKKENLILALEKLTGTALDDDETFPSELNEVQSLRFVSDNVVHNFEILYTGLDLALYNLEFELAGKMYYDNTYYYKLYENKSRYYQRLYYNLVTTKNEEYLNLLSSQKDNVCVYEETKEENDYYQKALAYAKDDYQNRAITESGLLRADYLSSFYLYQMEEKKLAAYLTTQNIYALGYQ